MKPGKYNITVNQGSSVRIPIQWTNEQLKPIDVTGCKISLEIMPSAPGAVKISCTTENGYITIPSSKEGKIIVEISSSITSLWSWRRGKYNMHIVFPSNYTYRILEGDVICNKKVG